MSSLVRWHTDPQEPDFFPDGKKEALHLDKLVDSGSYNPLYESIENKINEIKKIKGASAEENESVLWLRGLLNDFDIYVTRELHRIHYPLWAREWEIRNEYKQYYKTDPNPAWNIRAVMARLMTFKEIQKHVKDETFWHRPETRPVYSLDCLSGGIINDQTRPWKYVTGINPVHPRRGYMLTYEKPWIGKQLDPMHHWGVYMDKKLLGISDRYFMACCGELVGQTEGCWINLPEAKTKGAIEGVIQPYQLFPTVFNNVWENYVRNNSFPAADQIKEDYNIGTAFRDITKYDNLHKEIQSSWANASKIIRKSFKSYAKEIQDHLDANDSDAGREINPFENPKVLTPQGRTAIETPIQLVLRYNEIQCMGALVPPLIRDYVNEKIFRVADMLASFTYERMGGIEYTKADKSKGRIKMLKMDIDDTAQIDTMIKQIDESTDKPELKSVIKPELEKVKTKITERMAENVRRVRLANTEETLEEIRRAKMGQVTDVSGLDWKSVVAALNLFDTNDQILLDIEKEINDSLRSFRAGFTPPPTVTLPVYPPLGGFTDNLLDQLDTNINITKLTYEVNQTFFRPEEPVSTNTNPTYQKAFTFYKSVKGILDKPNYLTPTQYKRINSDVFIQEQANFAKATKDTDAELVQISNNLAVAAEKILYVQNKTGIKQAVKDAVITSVDTLDIAPTQARINALEIAKEKEAAKSQNIIDDAATKYEAVQKPKRDDAVKMLQQVKNTFKAPQNVKSPDDVKAEIAKIMAAVKALEPSDEYSQDYLEFNRKLETIQANLPKDNTVFQPRPDDLGLKTADEVEKVYVAKWKEANGLLGAATNLANALIALVNSLSTNSQDAKAKEVRQLLTSIEKNAEQALAFAETETQRKARIEREEAAKREAERKKREEDERIQRIMQLDRTYAAPMFEWLNNPKRKLNKSSITMEKLTKLEQQYNMEYKQLPGETSRTWQGQQKKRSGTILQDFITIQNAFQKKENFLRPSKVTDRPNALPSGLDDDLSLTTPVFKDQPFSALYVQNYDTTELIALYKDYAEYLIQEMHVDDKQRADLAAKITQKVQNLTAFPEQPVSLNSVANPDDTFDISDIDMQAPAVVPGDSVFTFTAPQNASNSCWLDSSIVSIFSIPQTTWVNALFNAKTMYNRGIELKFPSRSKIVPDPQNDCNTKDVKELHTALLADITTLEQPFTKERKQCAVRTYLSTAKGCLKRFVEREGDQDTPATFFESFVSLYGENTLRLQYVAHDWDKYGFNVKVRDVSKDTRAYIVDASQYFNPDLISQLKIDIAVASFNVDTDLRDGFQLSAIIAKAGPVTSGHFVTYLYDFNRKEWAFFNVIDNNEFVGWVKDLSQDKDVYGNSRSTPLISSVGLPQGVFDLKGVQNKGNFIGYKPAFFVFIRQDEIDAILKRLRDANAKKPAPAPVITITPTPIWTPSLDPFEKGELKEANKLVNNWYNAYTNSTKPAKSIWATDLKLLDYANNFISEITVEEHVKNTFVMPKSLWNDDTRRKALGYAYAKFQAWLDETDATKLKGLEADMRKALVAAQITEKPFDFTSQMSSLSITFLPTNREARDMFVALINRMKKETQTNQYWEIQLRKLLVQTQTKFQDLEK